MAEVNNKGYRLTVKCPDRLGIVATVSQLLNDYKSTIDEASQHSEEGSQQFFMRYLFTPLDEEFNISPFKEKFSTIANRYQMDWDITPMDYKPRVILMVSKEAHCLVDILHRWHSKELPCHIVAVISNHADLREIVSWYGLAFHHVPIDPDSKEEHFERTLELFEKYNPGLIMLARYMQIIPKEICQKYHNKMINIHHSFLPSFAGAKPYQQAYSRGVKLIGATCHYVTPDLDEGPIIEQDVVRVTHSLSVKKLKQVGMDVEKSVLARGMLYHLEGRVIVHENKTVVFL